MALPPLKTYEVRIIFQHIDGRGAQEYADAIARRVYTEPALDVDVYKARELVQKRVAA